jgi:hypothetical protein
VGVIAFMPFIIIKLKKALEKEIISAKGCIKNIEKPITKTKYMKLIIG